MTRSLTIPTFTFCPLSDADLPRLHEWLGRPHVAEWWTPTPTVAQVLDEYGRLTEGRDTTRPYIVLGDGEPIGFIQSYVAIGSGDGWWDDVTDPGVRGRDQFLADPALLNRGIGTAMVRAFVRRLFDDPAVTLVQTDPDPANLRAVRCYAKAGFRPIREIDTPDGRALLMHCARDSASRRPDAPSLLSPA